MEPKDRIIVALDVDSLETAAALVEVLAPHVGTFKIGLELITAVGGPDAIRVLQAMGARIMYDAKFHDIPNTMAGATRQASVWGVDMFTAHASAGYAALKATAEAKGASKFLAVTVLTSIDEAESIALFGTVPRRRVEEMAEQALLAGADGIVCSPRELAVLKDKKCLKVTPGVRPAWAAAGDQKRVMTPAEAIAAGAHYVVIGRPILKPPSEIGSPAEAAKRIAEEIASA